MNNGIGELWWALCFLVFLWNDGSSLFVKTVEARMVGARRLRRNVQNNNESSGREYPMAPQQQHYHQPYNNIPLNNTNVVNFLVCYHCNTSLEFDPGDVNCGGYIQGSSNVLFLVMEVGGVMKTHENKIKSK